MIKRMTVLAGFLLGLGSAAFANYRDIRMDQVGFSWAPSGTQQTVDSDVRLRGMGFLDLPVEDESNTVGIYKFGGFAAGIPLDYKLGKVELGYYADWGKVDDNSRQVDFYTGSKADSDTSGINLMGHVPLSTGRFGNGGLVFSKQWGWNNFDYNNGATFSNPNETEASVRDFNLGYGHKFPCGFLGGLNFAHKLDREKDAIGTSSNDEKTYTIEFSPSIAYTWRLKDDQELTAVGGPRFIQMEDDNSQGITESDIDGIKWGTGVLYQRLRTLRIAGFIETGELSGDRTLNGAGVGDQDLERTKYTIRGYYRIPEKPFSFGALYENVDRTLTDKNNAGATVSETQTERSTLGFGTAYHFNAKGLVGLEYRFLGAERKNNTFPSSAALNRDEDGSQFSLGGEYSLSAPLKLRAGYLYQNITSDPVGTTPEADLNLSRFSVGASYSMNDWEISTALWYATQKQDEVAFIQDEWEIQSTGIQLLGKYYWGLKADF